MGKSLKEFGDEITNQTIIHYKKYPRLSRDFECFMLKGDKHIRTKMIDTGNPLDSVQSVIDRFAPDLYIIVMEGWMLRVNSPIKNYKYGDATNSKQRVEVLMIHGKTTDLKIQYIRTFEIHRYKKDIQFKEIFNDDGSNLDMRSPKLR